jgi:long-chain acyl-CoA synthetase
MRAIMVGDGRPYLSVLLLLDQDAVVDWARRHGRPNLAEQIARIIATPEGVVVSDQAVLNALTRDVDRANAGVSRAEQVRKILPLIADLTPGGSIITATLKLRRGAFIAGAAEHIDALYEGD